MLMCTAGWHSIEHTDDVLGLLDAYIFGQAQQLSVGAGVCSSQLLLQGSGAQTWAGVTSCSVPDRIPKLFFHRLHLQCGREGTVFAHRIRGCHRHSHHSPDPT